VTSLSVARTMRSDIKSLRKACIGVAGVESKES